MIRETTTEFPAVYNGVSIDRLLAVYGTAAEKLSYLISDLPEQTLKAKPISGKWSIQELVFHLVDAELVGLVRMRMLIGETAKKLPMYDQDMWSVAMDYNSRTTDELLEAVRLLYILRDSNARMLKALPLQTWKKQAIHKEFGAVNLRNLLELYADHSERHLEQIMQRLELLGVSRKVKIELKERLY